MIADDLLALLRCPETRQPLVIAPADLVAKLEAQRTAGTLANQGGKPVAELIGGGLVREDGALFFPVHAGIPVLIADEAIRLAKQ